MAVATRGIFQDITERKRAEERIEALSRLKEDLLVPASPAEKMKRVTDGVVDMLDADFARVWLAERGDRCDSGCVHARITEGPHVCRQRDRCLHLVASSGRYTHLDGETHGRVPFGCYKIGRVASGESAGFLTNDVVGDPRVHNHAWARELGLVSFAGYKLVSHEGAPIGVLALFSQRGLSPSDEALLRSLASTTSEVVLSSKAEAERERLSLAVEQAAEHIMITDVEAAIQYVNPAFHRITGYSREEVIGRNPRLLQSGRHDEAFYQELWSTINSGDTWRGQLINKRKNGTLFTEQTTISPVRNTAGQIVNYVAVKRDITKEMELEAQLRQAQKMDAIGRLAGGVAHDFNNILTGISGFTELAMTAAASDAAVCKDLAEVRALAERAADLTRQLLAFSRRQTLQPIVLDVNQLVGGMTTMLTRLIGEDIRLLFVPAGGLGNVRADRGQLEQVVMNLAVNARDAMPRGGTLTIETADVTLDEEDLRTDGDVLPAPHVMLVVADTGCGMDEETRQNLFEPFFTTKERDQGTGLGLATVYGIVKQHGGHIRVESELDKGTTFRVYLPRAEEEAVSAVEGASVESLSGTETVLIVEDEAPVLMATERMLEARGYRILTAGSPSHAEGVLAEHGGSIALLLTDVVLPERTGRQLYESVRDRYPNLRVLYMSGYTDGEIARRGVLDPATPFLQKPFSPDTLARKVREALGASAPGKVGDSHEVGFPTDDEDAFDSPLSSG